MERESQHDGVEGVIHLNHDEPFSSILINILLLFIELDEFEYRGLYLFDEILDDLQGFFLIGKKIALNAAPAIFLKLVPLSESLMPYSLTACVSVFRMAALSSTDGPTLFDILKPTDVSVYAVSFFRNSIAIPRALSANARALLAKSVTFLIAFSARLRALLATCCPTSHAAFIPFFTSFPIHLLLHPPKSAWLFPCTSSLSSTNN